MKKINRGVLLKHKPWKVSVNGPYGVKVCLSDASGLKAGDKIYQSKLEDGTILITPAHVFEKEQKEKN